MNLLGKERGAQDKDQEEPWRIDALRGLELDGPGPGRTSENLCQYRKSRELCGTAYYYVVSVSRAEARMFVGRQKVKRVRGGKTEGRQDMTPR